MQAHRMHVTIPEDRRATIQFPRELRSGPAELIVLVPSACEAEPLSEQRPAERGRIRRLVQALAEDPRQFAELTAPERNARLERVMGAGRGLMSSSEELARRKRLEVELEESKFAR